MGTSISNCPHVSLPTNPGSVAGGGDTAPAENASPELAAAITALSTAVTQLSAVVDAMAGASTLGGGAPGKGMQGAQGGVTAPPSDGQVDQAASTTLVTETASTTPPTAPDAAEATPTEAPAAAPAAAPAPAPAPGAEKLILPVGEAPITSGFGANEGLRGGVPHTGTDYGVPAGTPIKAAAGGTVSFSGWENGGGGNVIIIDHGDGMKTLYAHQSELVAKVGDVVKQGDVIGKVGMTGAATGPHLHFEVIKGARGPGEVDPVTFMANGGTV